MSFFTRELKNLWDYFSITDEERAAQRAAELERRSRIIEEANRRRIERGEIFPPLKLKEDKEDPILSQRPSIADSIKPVRDNVEKEIISGFIPKAPPAPPLPDSLYVKPTEKDTRPVNLAPTLQNLSDIEKIKNYEDKHGSMNLGISLGPSSTPSRNDLLESIQRGTTLKPVKLSSTRSPEKTLLDDIKSGMNLQKPKPKPTKPIPLGKPKPKPLSFNEMLLNNPKFKRLSQLTETKDDWETEGDGRRKKRKPKKRVTKRKSMYAYY
jgi:hypothetical protein